MSSVALNFVASKLEPAKPAKRGGPSAPAREVAFMRGLAARSDIKYVVLRSQILLAAQPFVNLLAALPEHIRNTPHSIVVLRSGASILVDDLNALKRLVEDLRS